MFLIKLDILFNYKSNFLYIVYYVAYTPSEISYSLA